MARLLVSGARAPVALELARNLHRNNHYIIMVDSLSYPLARNTQAVNGFYKIPSPRGNIEIFKRKLLQIIQQECIEYFLPTCEEVFYLSLIKKDLETVCVVLCPDFEFISKLHSKMTILDLCVDMGIRIPTTHILDKKNLNIVDTLEKVVVKKEFSRFGTGVLLNPTRETLNAMISKNNGRFLLQEKVMGTEYCAYAIAYEGKVCAEAIYQPNHRAKISAGIYFKPIAKECITIFIRKFCEKYHYSGQISFDFILSEEGVYLLECNPRATSGVHLLSEVDFFKAFTGTISAVGKPSKRSKMIALAMLCMGLPIAIFTKNSKRWKADYFSADDVIALKGDKSFLFFQWLSFTELILIALRKRVSIREASTADIEWDGEKIT